MARMIPPRPAVETPASERRVYERFQSELPDTWTVIHSQRFLLPVNHRMRDGELDFLILDPSRGAIGLEVKGGRVARTLDGWFSVDRRNEPHEIKDPGKQARDAIYALARYWDKAPTFGGRGFQCPYCWGVVFPDIECPGDLGPDLPRDVILDRADVVNARHGADRVFRQLPKVRTPPRASGVKALVATLRERRPPASSLAIQFKEENEQLWRLTEEQKTLLDSLAPHPRAAIEGAAGTGKTLLAMEKARRLSLAGQRVLLLCFNGPLARDLRQKADGFEVEAFHGFFFRLARRAGLEKAERTFASAEERRHFYDSVAPLKLLEALEALPEERYDAIVVDEAQDFRPDWWPCLDEALRHGREGTLYAFYDPNQDIYGGGPPEALEVLPHRLVLNCRNTSRIADYASGLVGAEPIVRASTPKGEEVLQVTCRSDAEVIQAVADQLERLVRRQVDPGAIAIVSTRTLRNSPFAGDQRAGRFQLIGLDERDRKARGPAKGRRVVFETLHRFKGLESDVVILLDLPSGKHITARHHYVAASRARNLLIVVRLVGQEPKPRGQSDDPESRPASLQ